MALLIDNEPQEFFKGEYALTVDHTSGVVNLEMSVNGGNYIPIDDGTFTDSATKLALLPRCYIKASISGTAVVELNIISP